MPTHPKVHHMRKYGRTLHVGRLHLAIMGGQVFIDWRPSEPGKRWRLTACRNMWRHLGAEPTRQWRMLGLDIDWYATGNET